MAADDYSPRFAGDTSDPLAVTFTDSFGNPYNITGATALSLKLLYHNSGLVVPGIGSFQVVNGPAGTALYSWNAADTAITGLCDIAVSVDLPNGTKHFQTKPLEILAAF